MPSLSPPVRSLSRPGTHPVRRGFTLVELMTTLAVLVVLMAVAVPSMDEFTANNQMVSTKSAFATAVSLARTEAARRNKVVILQPVGTGPTGNEFVGGWELVVDEDNSGTADPSEPRIRRMTTRLGKVKLSGSTSLAFAATGALVGTSAQTYTVCRLSGASAGYSVTITPSGVADVAAITSCS
jgi:type IV fimbrial biogenesis protein FimT